MDITNANASKHPASPTFTFKRAEDNKDFLTTDGIPLLPDDASAMVTPKTGFIIKF
jgi:hypothetical protein